ncbi:MAG: hypothetical protein ACU0CO_05200, partial [Shimia sp.]
AALDDPEIRRLAACVTMTEDAEANAAFPERRFARVRLTLRDGREVTSDRHEPRWDHTAPPTDAELDAKARAYAAPEIGAEGADRLVAAARGVADAPLSDLLACIRE